MTSLALKPPNTSVDTGVHPKYRPDIDGMRAIAVMSVVLFHAFPQWIPGGFIGVDVFFVISGYLISTIIYGSFNRNIFSFAEFYARRIKRIFPPLLLVLSASYIFGWFTLYPGELQQLGKHIAGGATFTSNLLLWDESGYFDTSAEIKPFLHLWSLGIEEQFYIFWPLTVWVAWKARLNILTISVIVALLSFSWNVTHLTDDPSSVFYMPQTRIWELLIGSIVAYINLYKPSLIPQRVKIRNLLSLSGVLALGYGFTVITNETPFPGYWALAPSIGAALMIAAGPSAWFNKTILSMRPLVWLGLISFPLYLWHWPILSFARIIEGETPPAEIRFTAVVISILLASATYYLLETRLRKSSSRHKTATLTIMMVLAGTVGYITFQNNGFPDRSSVKSAEEFNSQFVGPNWKFAKNDLCLNRYPFDDAKSYGWWFCMTNKDSPPTVLLMGTSFANHLYPGFAATPQLSGNSILSIGACSPGAVDVTDPNAHKDITPCSGDRPYRQKLLINQIIENTKTVKYVIIDGLSARKDGGYHPGYISEVNSRIKYLESKGIQVIVFQPHILVNHDLKGCFSRPLKNKTKDCEISIDLKKQIEDEFEPIKKGITMEHPNVKFFDQNTLFCGFWTCSLTLNGMPIFRDQYNHYSEYASTELAKLFAKWAEVNEPGILVQ